MDPRERADAMLARARARGTYVVTPESATSPMDAASTLQIPRSLVSAIDRGDPEATMVLPAIAQEASTQMLASPPSPPAARKPAAEGQAASSERSMMWAPAAPAPPPEPEEIEGLVPTVKQPPRNRSSLSQRLDG